MRKFPSILSAVAAAALMVGAMAAPADAAQIFVQQCEGTGGTAACRGGNIGETVFTNTGLINAPPSVPEPSALALVGGALLLFGLVVRRRLG